MKTIRDLLARDLEEPIEEVIKVDQQDEATVRKEITEYVATDRIKGQYMEVLQAIADSPGEPHEGVGVWISGFFGSGKSSFAKNLGYVLANRQVAGTPAGQLFVQQLQRQSPGDPVVKRIADAVSYIDTRLDIKTIMFDVQVDRAVHSYKDLIVEILYSVLLRELDYAEDYDVAELEIELEEEGQLGEFVDACAALSENAARPQRQDVEVPVTLAGVDPGNYAVWRRIRKGAQRIQRTGAALHAIDPATYPSPDSWADSLQGQTEISVRRMVQRTFDLTARRRPGHTVVFIIDEVGQYVARSAEKIENLRAVVEHFGQEGRNRVLKGEAPAPVWVFVTSQEKLDEVVAAIDDKRVELARLQDRFRTRIDMAPADIREVASRRVLAKKPQAEDLLRQIYREGTAKLQTHTRLERTSRISEVDEDAFIQFYPYLPHFIDLSIDIVSGTRLQPGAPRHIGGSNRTIIKQAYEILVSDRTALAEQAVGKLVTLDMLFDLIEGNLPSERQRDITDIISRWPNDPWPARVAKAISLLEYVRDLPRSEANLAALLYREMDADSPLPEVERAVQLLEAAQFIRFTEGGWKLQTAQEKSWAAERNAYNPNPRERHEIQERMLRDVFSAPGLNRYQYRQLRSFRLGVTWEGRTLTSGDAQVPLDLRLAEGPDDFAGVCDTARSDSRAEAGLNHVFWVLSLTSEIDDIVAEVYRSQRMVGKYNQMRAQGKINKEESASLEAEKTDQMRREERLKHRLETAMAGGSGFFRGVRKDGAAMGKEMPTILKAMLDKAVPDLYPKLEMGARSLKGNEAEELLKAANLNGLPKIFYAPPDGLDLVTREGGKQAVNLSAPIVKEVTDYLSSEHAYGNKVTGRTLENHFGGLGYGWEREMLWLVCATLLRGGAIEVAHQGRRYRNHMDAQARVPFSGTNAFRAASFAPREAIGLPTLVKAAQRYESLTGEEVDVEESTIAQAFQTLARREMEALLPVEATSHAYRIPVESPLADYHNTLETVLNSPSDDCVRMLAGEGASFQEQRDQVTAIRRATDEAGLQRLGRLRTVTAEIWPLLEAEGLGDEGLNEQADRLRQHLQVGTYYQMPVEVDAGLDALEGAYREIYTARHTERQQAYAEAMDEIKGQPNWPAVPETMQPAILRPLSERCNHDLDLPTSSVVCATCRASLNEMASDLAALDRLRSDALLRVQQVTAPEEKVERVRVADLAVGGQSLSTEEDVQELVDALKDRLLKLVAAGVRVILE
jgi:hypothetical protein